jgi:hypothetical protein
MNSVASVLSTARIKIDRKNPSGLDAILKTGDYSIDRIDIKII